MGLAVIGIQGEGLAETAQRQLPLFRLLEDAPLQAVDGRVLRVGLGQLLRYPLAAAGQSLASA